MNCSVTGEIAVSDGWVAEFNEQVLLEREDALAELIALAEQAAGGVGGLVFLGGEAGVGKSALAGALIELSVAHPHPWDLGELSWWLAVAGVRRPTPVPIARPFALMVAGNWQAAASAWQALGCPLRQALALAAIPELAAARQSLMLAESLGAAGVRRAMLADRHARGLPLPRGPRPASRANPSGLTAREIDVLRLLVDGLSNADVARRLFLSEKTVGHHVSSVLHKLGEPTRSRAVATAMRRGIVQPQSRQAAD